MRNRAVLCNVGKLADRGVGLEHARQLAKILGAHRIVTVSWVLKSVPCG